MAKRVLIVDGSFGDRMVMRDFLISLGHRVVGEARNYLESFDKYRELRPDIVMMGASVPDMDGVAAVSQILRFDPDAVILMCVNRGQRSIAMEAMQVGAKDFITKPLNIRQLRRVIQAWGS